VKLKAFACGVFEPELRALIEESPHEIDLVLLDAGLHERPDELRRAAQEAIDNASDVDAVVLVYGLCGRGTAGLLARQAPVVIPRVHDCLTLFLGSRAEYRRQFERHPGTFYITAGWYEHKIAPRGRAPSERLRTVDHVESDPRYRQWAERYGPENARAIIEFHDSWKRNYTRAAFIDTGLERRETYEAYARDMAAEFGWQYEALTGHTDLLRALLGGEWDRPDLLVLQPGERSVSTGDDQVLGRIASSGGAEGRRGAGILACDSQGLTGLRPDGRAAPGTLALGIDAGGTFTDCVILDLGTGEVLAKAKAPTTHHDLLVGIDQALSHVKLAASERIRMVALSTTLATNAIAEDKGGFPGALIMTPDGQPDPRITWRPQRLLSARMDIGGSEQVPFDRDACLRAIDELLAAGVEAFAVSGYASVRNPAHEDEVRELIASRCSLPVICGHELSTRFNYVSRANTAILNARLLPVIRALLDAAREVLRRHGVTAPLMIVKGDGSLITEAVARERPVETVLSGPAASVAGARYLTDEPNALVMDVGGTTTDTALVEDRLVRISEDGANVAGWQTCVAAADIRTVGLGGDSHIRFTVDRRLLIGPRRVIPLCCLAYDAPDVEEQLLRFSLGDFVDRSSAASLDFFRLGRSSQGVDLEANDREIVAALRRGPLSRLTLARRLGLPSHILLGTEQLERLGFVQRAGLTPTDLLHVTGEFTAWNVAAARHALAIFAALYGRPPEEVSRQILADFVRRLCLEALRRELGDELLAHSEGKPAPALIEAALGHRDLGAVSVHLRYDRPIVAIGAPVGAFFPEVGRRLNARIVIPPHAEVANAIGAVAAEVVVREEGVVRPGEVANYVFHWKNGRQEFETLDHAVDSARDALSDLAVGRALDAGAAEPRVQVDVNERRGYLADGQLDLIEVHIEARAAGRPAVLSPVP
jgi:N-methylhydantoinase A/oxoprolinase/acetone carboxylase beta subunit